MSADEFVVTDVRPPAARVKAKLDGSFGVVAGTDTRHGRVPVVEPAPVTGVPSGRAALKADGTFGTAAPFGQRDPAARAAAHTDE